MPTEAGMLKELLALRKGRGLLAPDLPVRLGPGLRALARVEPDTPVMATRVRLARVIEEGCRRLPTDLETGVRAALALHPQAQHRFLHERLEWYAAALDREVRTARRRMDDGLLHLAEVLSTAASGAATSPGSSPTGEEEWYVESLRTLVRLDGPHPVVTEERTIVATVDGLSELEASVSLGPPRDRPESRPKLAIELEYGGHLATRTHPSPSFFRSVLVLPRPLRVGERHRFGLTIRVPIGHSTAPYYVVTPFRRYDRFTLLVRSDPAGPVRFWRVNGLPPRMLEDPPDDGDQVATDRFGELSLGFGALQLGRSYGLRWSLGGSSGLRV